MLWAALPFVLGAPLLALVAWAVLDEAAAGTEGMMRVAAFVVAGLAVIAAGEFCGRRSAGGIGRNEAAELERLHHQFRRSEQRFEAILTQSAVGIVVADMQGRLLTANDRFCSMLGYSCAQLRFRTYQELTWPEDVASDVAQAQRLVRGEIDSYELEKRMIRRDGSPVWVHLTCSAIRGDVDCAVAIIQDVSERHRAQEALQESESRFRTLAENARVAIGIVQDLRIVYANRFFAAVSGYSVEELQSMELAQLAHPDYRATVTEITRRRQAGELVPATCEFKMMTRSGETRWIDFAIALAELNGLPALIGAGFDITSRKQEEDTLRASEARLAEAKDVAEAANRAKDQFLAVLSHELRTPLTPVLASTSSLQNGATSPDEAKESLEMIRRNVELEARLIDDLLDLTRLSWGKLELRPQTIQVAQVLRHTIEICANDIAAKGLKLQVDLGQGHWWLRADPQRLQQVFWNLLNNAAKFTPTGGQVAVRVAAPCPDDECVTVEVADTGIGIAPDVLPRIFGAFEQGSRLVTKQFGGLGLGLAITKAVVELHGGTITAHSEGLGRGATFRVVLPTVATPQETADAAAPEAPKTAGRRARILLVEDHVDTAKVMSRILHAAGHTVRVADSVHSGLRAATEEPFDLVLSDLGLPDGSGLDLMRQLREMDGLKGIALSGFGMDEDIARSRSAGFSEHLTKPVSIDKLEAAIARVLGA